MKISFKCIYLLFPLFYSCSVNNREDKVVISKEDSVMINKMYSYIDTLKGHWFIRISKEKALEEGISEKIYRQFEESVCEVNMHIDAMKENNPNVAIGYNFPKIN